MSEKNCTTCRYGGILFTCPKCMKCQDDMFLSHDWTARTGWKPMLWIQRIFRK